MSRSKYDGMVVDTLSTSSTNRRGTALFLNGFPGAIGPLPGVVAALDRGWDVVFPQYPGTYDSEGEFSPSEAARRLSKLLRSSHLGGDANLPTVAIAHSFGAFILVDLLRLFPQSSLRKILLLAPVVSYKHNPDTGIREDLVPHVSGVIKSHPRTYRIGNIDEWKTISEGNHPIERMGPWSGTVRAVVGDTDDTFETKLFEKQFPSTMNELVGCTDVAVEVISGAGHAMHELLPHAESVSDVLG